MSLLEFVMSTTFLQFDGEFYKQVHRAPMGSQVSVVVQGMYMEELEEEAMDTDPQDTRPALWRWYIINSLKVVERDKRDELTIHLNSIDNTRSISSWMSWRWGEYPISRCSDLSHFSSHTCSTTSWMSSSPCTTIVITLSQRKQMQQKRSSMWTRLLVHVAT